MSQGETQDKLSIGGGRRTCDAISNPWLMRTGSRCARMLFKSKSVCSFVFNALCLLSGVITCSLQLEASKYPVLRSAPRLSAASDRRRAGKSCLMPRDNIELRMERVMPARLHTSSVLAMTLAAFAVVRSARLHGSHNRRLCRERREFAGWNVPRESQRVSEGPCQRHRRGHDGGIQLG